MQMLKIQNLLDGLAISASLLCVLHCLLMPFLLILVPIISSTFVAGEEFHFALVVFVLPLSIIALFLGCSRHKDRTVIILGAVGLTSLVLIALFGHDFLGEIGEKVATVISGTILAAGHLRNFKMCRHDRCNA